MMVTLQGVIILHISDFRRFFNHSEFWSKKEDFIRLFKSEIERSVETPQKPKDPPFFVDNEEEVLLLTKLYDWLTNPNQELSGVKIEQEELKIEKLTGDVQIYLLDRLLIYIDDAKKQNKYTSKQLIGLTLFYLLLNANKNDSDIAIKYKMDSTFNGLEYFNLCWEDKIFPPANTMSSPLTSLIFVNMNSSKDIVICNGAERVTLKPRDCVVGLFCGAKCYKLLPNEVADAINKITLKLTACPDSYNARLEIHNRQNGDEIEYVDNVISFLYHSQFGYAYVNSTGNETIPEGWRTLKRKIEYFKKKYPEEKILSIESETLLISEKRIY